MIQDENLVAQHGEAVQIVGALMMGDGDQRCLKAGYVRFERDGDLVTEAPLDSGAHRSEKPRRRGRQAEAGSRGAYQAGLMAEDSFPEQLEPQRQQRIGEHRQLRQHERGQHQPGLVAVAELAQAPHRGERRRQVVA